MKTNYSKSAAGTFKLNKCQPIHRWYSYIEGYSSCLIEDIVDEIGSDNISTIYDPFCGTGTTSLVAASRGIASFYSETNPFMRDVIEAKINDTKKLLESGTKTNNLSALLEEVKRLPDTINRLIEISNKKVATYEQTYCNTHITDEDLEMMRLGYHLKQQEAIEHISRRIGTILNLLQPAEPIEMEPDELDEIEEQEE